MVLLICFVTLFFLCSAFLSTPQGDQQNIFVAYFSSEVGFIFKHIIWVSLGFLGFTLLLSRINFDKKYTFSKIYFFSTLQGLLIILVGFFMSYVLLFVIAFIQLNSLAVLINIDQKAVGLVTDTKIIATVLQENQPSPEIFLVDGGTENTIVSLAKLTSGRENFYGKFVLSAIPEKSILSSNMSDASIILFDNTLFVRTNNLKDLEIISPLIGYVLVKQNFPQRQIKTYPKVTLMEENDYVHFRQKLSKERIKKIDEQLKKLDGYISSLSASLQIEKNKKNSNAQKKLLAEYEFYTDFFEQQKKLSQSQEEKIFHELGVFIPNESIKIVWQNKKHVVSSDYLATLTHEYLHYASYVSKERYLTNSFFEEGLTEYFTSAVLQENRQTKTHVGYPVQVKIIQQMTQMIPESEFAEMYFNKDETSLEKALDRVYGDGFYQENYILFETLQYASEREQVKLANVIMKKIGGNSEFTVDML